MQKSILFLLALLTMSLSPVFSYQNGIEVKTTSPNVNVYLDGKFVGITESAFGMNVLRIEDIKPGSHRIRCEAKGFDSFNKSVTVTATDVLPLEVRFTETRVKIMSLDATSGAQVKSTGTIKVISKPTGATALLNGRQKGLADLVYEDVPVGEKEIEVYFNKRKSDEYLTLSFELSKDDNVIVTADFFNGKIYTDAKYKVTFNSTPKGILYINDKRLGLCPITKTLQTGSYDVKIQLRGYDSYVEKLRVSRNDFMNVNLREKSLPAFIEVALDRLIGSEDVYVNDTYIGNTPLSRTKMGVLKGLTKVQIGTTEKLMKLKKDGEYKIIQQNEIFNYSQNILEAHPNFEELPQPPEYLPETIVVEKWDWSAIEVYNPGYDPLIWSIFVLPQLAVGTGVGALLANEYDEGGYIIGIGATLVTGYFTLSYLGRENVSQEVPRNTDKNTLIRNSWEAQCRLINDSNDALEEKLIQIENQNRGSFEWKIIEL